MSSGSIRAGRGYIEMILKDGALTAGLRASAGKLRAWGASVATIGAAGLGVTAAIAAPFIGAIKAAGNAAEVMSKFETVFGDQTAAAKEWADNFAADVGRSERQIAEFYAGTQDLFVPLGFDPSQANQLSQTITGLAVDLASFNNKADADSLNDLQAALTGSGEVMKKYGVVLNETGVKAELLKKGLKPETASEQEKVLARLAIILRGTTAAQGDAIRTSDSLSNQYKRLTGKIENAAVAVGNALLPIVTPIVAFLGDIVSYSVEWMEANEGLARGIFLTVAGLGTFAGLIVAAGGLLSIAGTAAGLFAGTLATIGTIVGALVSPLGLAAAAIGGLTYAALKYTVVGDQALAFLGRAFATLSDDATAAVDLIKKSLAAGDIAGAAKILWELLKLEWVRGTQFLKSEWIAWKAFFLQVWNEATYDLAGVFIDATAGIQSIWTEITYGMADAWNVFVTGAANKWDSASNWIAKGLLKIQGQMDETFDTEGALRELDRDFRRTQNRRNSDRDEKLLANEAERRAEQERIASNRQGALAVLDQERTRERRQIDAAAAADLARADEAVSAAQAAYADALKAATAKQAADANAPADKAAPDLAKILDGIKLGLATGAAKTGEQAKAAGIFGGQAAELIFGGRDETARRHLTIAERQLAEQQRTREALERGPRFA